VLWFVRDVTGNQNGYSSNKVTLYRWSHFMPHASCPERSGDVFWRLLFVRVAYLQDERQLPRVSPEDSGFVRPEKKAAFHPVSRQPAQTMGVRKHLPFSTGVTSPLKSHLDTPGDIHLVSVGPCWGQVTEAHYVQIMCGVVSRSRSKFDRVILTYRLVREIKF